MIEIPLAGAKQDIIDQRLHFLFEGAVATHAQLEVSAVVAHHVDESFGQFVAVLLVDPTLDGERHLGMFEGQDVVPSASIATIGGEVAAIVQTLEGDAEVVAAGIHRVFEVLDGIGGRQGCERSRRLVDVDGVACL